MFGPDKYFLPMTLSEAVRDDIVALEAGVYRLLPYRDTSGRQLVLLEPRRNTGHGYTTESLVSAVPVECHGSIFIFIPDIVVSLLVQKLRALWYTIDTPVASECSDLYSGFVYIGWNKDSTLWDIGDKVYSRLSHFEKTCWPVKFVGAHIGGSSSIVFRLIKPILNALTDRRGRSRMVIHDTSGNELLADLAEYGILKHMLPREMGGSVELNQAEWIANRRAVEMEEI